MTFTELAQRLCKQEGKELRAPSSLLCFDPGNTTGYAYFQGTELVEADQVITDDIPTGTDRYKDLLTYYKPEVVVAEDYRIYSWRDKQHAWSELHTPKLVGILESQCYTDFIPLVKQTAHAAKSFCTDKRLQEWGMWEKGKKHARDAIRHGCYYILFGKNTASTRQSGHQVG